MNPLLLQNMFLGALNPQANLGKRLPVDSLIHVPQPDKKLKTDTQAQPFDDSKLNSLLLIQQQQRNMQNMLMGGMFGQGFGFSGLFDAQNTLQALNLKTSNQSEDKALSSAKKNLEKSKNKINKNPAQKDILIAKQEYVHDDLSPVNDNDDKRSQTTQGTSPSRANKAGKDDILNGNGSIPTSPLFPEEVGEPALVEFTLAFPEWDLASIFGYLKYGDGKTMNEFGKERKDVRDKKIMSRQSNKIAKKLNGGTKVKGSKKQAF